MMDKNNAIDLDEIFAAIDEAQRMNRYNESAFSIGVAVARLKCLADDYRARQAAPDAPTGYTPLVGPDGNCGWVERPAATTASASSRCIRCDGKGLIANSSPVRSTCTRCNGTGRTTASSQEAQAAHAGAVEKDAARYRWLRDKSEPGICSFYLSVGQAFKNVKFAPETVDEAIDAAIATSEQKGPQA